MSCSFRLVNYIVHWFSKRQMENKHSLSNPITVILRQYHVPITQITTTFHLRLRIIIKFQLGLRVEDTCYTWRRIPRRFLFQDWLASARDCARRVTCNKPSCISIPPTPAHSSRWSCSRKKKEKSLHVTYFQKVSNDKPTPTGTTS